MSDRMRRVNESVRAVVAETVGQLKDPRIGMVTVTSVRITPDLREGTVFVSVLGNEKRRQATLRGLESAHGVVQARVARELGLKRTPTLTFAYDETVERAVRMTALIEEVSRDLPSPDDEPGDDDAQ
jgi:ribosome-binding factor A